MPSSALPVTLAVPACNAGRHLDPLLRSLLAQDPPAERILLVDDCSDDGTAARAREIGGGRVEVFENDVRLGLGANWNRAAQHVRTEFFALAHQDDVYDPAFVGAQHGALAGAPEAALAHCHASAIDAEGRPLPARAEAYKRGLWRAAQASGEPPRRRAAASYRALLRGNFITCPSVLYRSAAFRAVGGFREDLKFVTDWDFCLRVLCDGWQFVSVDQALVAYRRHGGRATEAEMRTLNRYREELDLLERARKQGIDVGFLPVGATLSPALRHNVVLDAFADLERGVPEAAAAKFEFLDQHAPSEARTALVRTARRLMQLGRPGRGALRAGLAMVLLTARWRSCK